MDYPTYGTDFTEERWDHLLVTKKSAYWQKGKPYLDEVLSGHTRPWRPICVPGLRTGKYNDNRFSIFDYRVVQIEFKKERKKWTYGIWKV